VPNLIKSDAAVIGEFAARFHRGSRDVLKLHIQGDVVKASIKRANGEVHSATAMLGGRFQSRTSYDAAGASPEQRRKLVKQLSKEGFRQTAIADQLGVSQATICQDLKRIKAARAAS
jgi:DNA-binding NarL/FixJ family response regulator